MSRRRAGASALSRAVVCLALIALAACAPAPSPSATPSRQPESPSPSPSPSAQLSADIPDEVVGLPVITVSEVLELASSDARAGQVLAVKGWYTPAIPTPCPSPLVPQAIIELSCGDFTSQLTEYPERVLTIGPTGWSGQSPTGPSFSPKVIWPTSAISPDADWDGRPFLAVLIGHLGDERAELCSPEALETCRDTFVVDRIAWLGGTEPPVVLQHDALVGDIPQLPTIAEVKAMVATADPTATILSMAILDASTLRTIEPALGYEGREAVVYARAMADLCAGTNYGPTVRLSIPLLFSLGGVALHRPACPEATEPIAPEPMPTSSG